jgi:pyrroline-5-carboxylate reductase
MAEVTFVGSAELFAGSNKSAEEWRQAVSSKGGSTVEAINHMQENKFAEIFGEAIEKAKKRWEDL